jgi:hypothetical protein
MRRFPTCLWPSSDDEHPMTASCSVTHSVSRSPLFAHIARTSHRPSCILVVIDTSGEILIAGTNDSFYSTLSPTCFPVEVQRQSSLVTRRGRRSSYNEQSRFLSAEPIRADEKIFGTGKAKPKPSLTDAITSVSSPLPCVLCRAYTDTVRRIRASARSR